MAFDEALNWTTILEWHSFKVGRHSFTSNALRATKLQQNCRKFTNIKKLIREVHHLIMKKLADKFELYYVV